MFSFLSFDWQEIVLSFDRNASKTILMTWVNAFHFSSVNDQLIDKWHDWQWVDIASTALKAFDAIIFRISNYPKSNAYLEQFL